MPMIAIGSRAAPLSTRGRAARARVLEREEGALQRRQRGGRRRTAAGSCGSWSCQARDSRSASISASLIAATSAPAHERRGGRRDHGGSAPATVRGRAARSSRWPASASIVGWSNISVAGSGFVEGQAGAEPVAQLHRHQRIEARGPSAGRARPAARSASSRSTRTTRSRTKSRSSSEALAGRRRRAPAGATLGRLIGGRGGGPRRRPRPSRRRRRRRRLRRGAPRRQRARPRRAGRAPRPASPARGQASTSSKPASRSARSQVGGGSSGLSRAQIVGEVLPAFDQPGASCRTRPGAPSIRPAPAAPPGASRARRRCSAPRRSRLACTAFEAITRSKLLPVEALVDRGRRSRSNRRSRRTP